MKIEITLTLDSGKRITLTPGEVEELRQALDIDRVIKAPVIFPYYPTMPYPTTGESPCPYPTTGDGGIWVVPRPEDQPQWQSEYPVTVTIL